MFLKRNGSSKKEINRDLKNKSSSRCLVKSTSNGKRLHSGNLREVKHG